MKKRGKSWPEAEPGQTNRATGEAYPMNLRTRLSRSNGYRVLGMFDESILELEAIEFGENRWHPLVIEAR